MVNKPKLAANPTAVFRDLEELFRYAASYGELMVGLYALLFDDTMQHSKKQSAEDLYDQALEYIREKYVMPISIGNLCSEIGISQTYLSRLFRKFGKRRSTPT